ncbi:hypothetical protein OPV22_008542 [Ensete ventricosum]|uniref:Uncharacterized protein n=1 Tax=Ensete ventricosum TaxID=4639 RepID=A0AAV8PWV4_ENSVE|nr:hypothetical protein OPV22_008542 [Ensete ventricosum]
MKWTGLYCKVIEPDSVESTRTLPRSGLELQSRELRSPHELSRLALRPLVLPPLLPPSSAAGKVSDALHTVRPVEVDDEHEEEKCRSSSQDLSALLEIRK